MDAGSNIASRTGPTATYTYDTANRLTNDGTQVFSWNTADRLTGRGPDTFGFDPLDRMTSSTVAATARTYVYNGDGLLKSRIQGTTTNFLWDPSSSPSRLLMQGSDRLVYGLGPLYVVKADGSTSSFARDGGKSVRAEVNGSGVVTASFRYRAYGAIAVSNGASVPSYLGYAGQLQDPSRLLYMRARWYDPAVGRFTTRDPAAGSADVPATLNAFNYSALNPLLLTDPSGLAFQEEIAAGGCDDTCDSSGQSTTTVPAPAQQILVMREMVATSRRDQHHPARRVRGKAISFLAWTARRSEPSSNAPPGSPCCCTCLAWRTTASPGPRTVLRWPVTALRRCATRSPPPSRRFPTSYADH